MSESAGHEYIIQKPHSQGRVKHTAPHSASCRRRMPHDSPPSSATYDRTPSSASVVVFGALRCLVSSVLSEKWP